MIRRFERDGRFWEIDYTPDKTARLSWGAIGAPVQRHDRVFDSRGEVLRYAEAQIAQQIAKGYAEVAIRRDVDEAPPLPSSRFARFEGDDWFVEVVQSAMIVQVRTGTLDEEKVEDHETFRFKALPAAAACFDEHSAKAQSRGGVLIDNATREARLMEQRRAAATERREVARVDRQAAPTHDALEQQCWESPDTAHPWEVYADFLEAAGDPRAELAAAHRAGKSVTRIIAEQLRGIADEEDVEEEYRGSADGEVTITCELKFGFVRHAMIKLSYDPSIDLDLVTARFLASPLGRFVDSLRFGLSGYENDNDWGPTLRAVVESSQAKHIRRLAFDAFDSSECELSWVEYGDFTGLLAKLPVLEHVHIRSGGGGTLGKLELPTLKSFVRESGGLQASELASITGARWPNLESLVVWTGSGDYGAEATISTIEPILHADGLPKLRHLGIANSELSDELPAALARSKILPQLHSLDLSRGIAASAFARELETHAGAFRHLASIDLSLNILSFDDIARIKRALDNVITNEQRVVDEARRYVSIGE